MKSLYLSLFLSFIGLNTAISCSCRTLPDFFNNTHVRDYGKNCIVVVDSVFSDFIIEDWSTEVGYFTIIDTLSKMETNIGESIFVHGASGANCGVSISKFNVGDTLLLSLIDVYFEGTQSDTFFLGGCGESYLQINNTEFSNWTTAEFKQSINDIISSTEENVLSTLISVFPNPATDKIYIHSENQSIQNIQIYNSAGGLVLRLKGLKTNNQSIVTAHLATGFYILEINTLEGAAYKKILKN